MATERDPDFPGLLIMDFPGGCPMVVDPRQPHLGGNMRGGDKATDYSATLWPWILATFHPRVVLDVGCAEGHALRWFQAAGVATVIGIEGLWQNAKRCGDGIPVIVHDLETGPIRVEGIDLIWCCDVVEHVQEKHVGYVLETLRQAPLCLLAHGTEENELSGWHHVNNQGHQYWIDALASVDMIYDEAATIEAKKVAVSGWFAHSGKVFRRATA